MEENVTKICKMCCKEIPVKAKKCPYCHHWQNKSSMIVWSPLFPTIVFLIPIVIMWVTFKNMLDKGEEFTPYRNQITISNSEMTFGQKKVCDALADTVAVIGTMSNRSPVPWKDVQIEVRFFDGNDKLIDSKQQKDYPYEVPADDNATFKISTLREFPKEQYVKYEVSIISAKDARSRW